LTQGTILLYGIEIVANVIANKREASTPHVGVILPRGDADGVAFREVAITAEELGYGSIWTTEHIAIPVSIASRYPFSEDGVPTYRPDAKWFEGMVALGFAAAVTSRIRLGTSVIPLFNRDPLSLAKQAATVDCLSSGRLELGIGAGWLVEEAEVLGHPSDRRSRRLDEAIDIMRLAWTEHPVEFRGEFHDIPPVGVSPKPVQGAEIPIWIGGASPAALRTTTSRAHGNIVWSQNLDEIARITEGLKATRSDVQVAASVYYDADYDRCARRATALIERGVDRVLLSPPGAVDTALDWLAAFARDAIPSLSAARKG
jgi:probable F420-dependent oxidoreductase